MTDQILILLSRYLHGEMPPDERQALEMRLRQEPELSQSLRELQISEQAIQARGDQVLKASLDARGAERLATQPADKNTRRLWPYFVAAAAAVAILAAIFLLPNQSGPQWQEMAEAFPLPSAPTSVRGNLDLPELRQKGTESYLRLQHREAINHWRAYQRDTVDREIDFYLGIAYQQVGMLDSASYYLQQVPPENSLYPRASW
ncbi:MAG: hypothetical protein AAFQ87_16435 [Bacteroidota bacterium]